MTSDTVESAEPVAARILLVDDDLGARTELGNQLVMGGFDVRSLPDPTALQRTLGEWRPNLLILDELFPGTTGREVSLRLRAQGATFDIPVVGLLSEPSIPRALQWLRSGATDLWTRGTAFDPVERTQALLDELSQTRVHAADVRARLVAYARRRTLHGTVLFYPDTPFEGRVRFEFGALVSSRTGAALEGTSLDELLALDDAAARWVPGDEVVAVSGPPGGSYRPKVLVVEDDDALRGLLLKQLASYGTVEGAADGLEGLLKGTRQDFDVVVADLNLPGLDGWGLLRQLRQHTTAREAAIIVLSAHDELRETLKAARAGARAYLKKTGRAKPLLDTLERVLAPRKQAWDSLARREPTALDLRLVGPMWALRTIAELDLVGALAIEEPLGRFEVRVAYGQLVRAEAQLGVERLEGPGALEALLS
ncbi:MAG: response regulator, partial [Myxococcaceae bacterium]|nr:response regulator [Myxococcaceae bacterium]